MPDIISRHTYDFYTSRTNLSGECANLAPISRKAFHATEPGLILLVFILSVWFVVNSTHKFSIKKSNQQTIRDVFDKNVPKTCKLLYPQPNFDAKKQEKRHFSLIIVRF